MIGISGIKRIRQHVVNKYGIKVVKNETVPADLGSGLIDRNGTKIYENDMIRLPNRDVKRVVFTNG